MKEKGNELFKKLLAQLALNVRRILSPVWRLSKELLSCTHMNLSAAKEWVWRSAVYLHKSCSGLLSVLKVCRAELRSLLSPRNNCQIVPGNLQLRCEHLVESINLQQVPNQTCLLAKFAVKGSQQTQSRSKCTRRTSPRLVQLDDYLRHTQSISELYLLARKLENWEDAATDAEIAQEIDPRNVKVGFSGQASQPETTGTRRIK